MSHCQHVTHTCRSDSTSVMYVALSARQSYMSHCQHVTVKHVELSACQSYMSHWQHVTVIYVALSARQSYMSHCQHVTVIHVALSARHSHICRTVSTSQSYMSHCQHVSHICYIVSMSVIFEAFWILSPYLCLNISKHIEMYKIMSINGNNCVLKQLVSLCKCINAVSGHVTRMLCQVQSQTSDKNVRNFYTYYNPLLLHTNLKFGFFCTITMNFAALSLTL